MRLAVIDCGTNTFHLLIVELQPDGSFKQLYRNREYVRLGQEGLDHIGDAPFHRGLDCIRLFDKIMRELGVKKHRAFGTEALRRADNGADFVQVVRDLTQVEIQLISGDEEARLIHLGVKQAVPVFEGKTLIMDIGGGSVEFIVASEEEVFWAQSFPIGVQVLFSRFHKNDPISPAELDTIHRFLDEMLAPLHTVLRQHQPHTLTGASGSFEAVEDMLVRQRRNPLFSIITLEDFYKIYRKILTADYDTRLKMPGLPKERVELIVVAFVLMDYIIRLADSQEIITSAYAMKEGMLLDMGNA